MKRSAFGTGFLLLALVAPVRADSAPAKPVKVSFELLKTKHIAVQIKVNGKGPYRVIFDTGAPINVFNNKIAKEAGLLKDAKPAAISLFGVREPTKVKSIELGDVKAEDVPVVIMDHPTVEAISSVLGPIEGIVGFPFFARYRMTLDYQAKEMSFVPSGFEPPDVMQAMMNTVMAMMEGKPGDRQVLAPAALWGMSVAKETNDEQAGVTVKDVLPDGPAAKAGLVKGDRLLTLDGRWTDSVADCYTATGFVKAGKTVTLVVRRDGKEKELTVKPIPGL